MLKKGLKIKGGSALSRVFKKGRKIRLEKNSLFSMRVLQRRGNGALFAVTIPSALKLNAVKRNKVRRRVYEAIRKNYGLTKTKNYDIVLVVHSPLAKIGFPQIEAELVKLFSKLL